MLPSTLRRAHQAPAAPAKEGPFRRGLLLSAWSASARGLGQQAPNPVPQPHPGPLGLAHPPAHAQAARYHWWKSCSLTVPFLLRFCPGASSTLGGTE